MLGNAQVFMENEVAEESFGTYCQLVLEIKYGSALMAKI